MQKAEIDCSTLNLEGKWKEVITRDDDSSKKPVEGELNYRMVDNHNYERVMDNKVLEKTTLLDDSCVIKNDPGKNLHIWYLKITKIDAQDSNTVKFIAYYCNADDCSKPSAVRHEWTKISGTSLRDCLVYQ